MVYSETSWSQHDTRSEQASLQGNVSKRAGRIQDHVLHAFQLAERQRKGKAEQESRPQSGRAIDELGKPVARTVDLATRSTPDKPILPGGVLPSNLERYLTYNLSLSDARRREIDKLINRGGYSVDQALKEKLKLWEYKKYEAEFSSSSASGQTSHQSDASSDDEQPSRRSDASSDDEQPSRRSDASSDDEQPSRRSDASSDDEQLESIGPSLHFGNRYKYTSEGATYDSRLPGSCTLDVAMTVLNDYGQYPHHDSVAQLIGYPGSPMGGAQHIYIPSALAQFGVSYTLRRGLNIKGLQEILDRGNPVISSIKHHSGFEYYNHVIVVDKIEADRNQRPKFVCIRDGSSKDFPAYKVPIADFERAWSHNDIVPNF